MKITNLGPIDFAEVHFNKLNIFYGPNNSGKTYMSYAVYGIIKHVFSSVYENIINDNSIPMFEGNSEIKVAIDIEKLKSRIVQEIIKDVNQNFKEILSDTFVVQASIFNNTSIVVDENDIFSLLIRDDVSNVPFHENISSYRFTLSNISIEIRYDNDTSSILVSRVSTSISQKLEKTDISSLNIQGEVPKKFLKRSIAKVLASEVLLVDDGAFYLPAERNGANVFREELNRTRSNLISENNGQPINENLHSYPKPISDYLVFLNSISSDSFIMSNDSVVNFVRKHISSDDQKRKYIQNVLKGQFVYTKGNLNFRQLITKNKKSRLQYRKEEIPFNITSSSVKSLYGLSDHLVNPFIHSRYGITFLDEPEMNLDPKKQIELAQVLGDLVSSGKKVFISTHSDYMFRKFTNLSLENHINKTEETVSAYHFSDGTITKIVSPWNDDYIENFDSPLEKLNEEFNKLYNKLEPEEQNFD